MNVYRLFMVRTICVVAKEKCKREKNNDIVRYEAVVILHTIGCGYRYLMLSSRESSIFEYKTKRTINFCLLKTKSFKIPNF